MRTLCIQIIYLTSLSGAVFSELIHRKFGKHDFPLLTKNGDQTANEFQLLEPGNARDVRGFSAEHRAKLGVSYGMYEFVDISPLAINNDDVVTVTFQSTIPMPTDWIGAYSPADGNISSTVPIKYAYADDSADYIATGKGVLTFNLTNVRADVGFFYFTNGLSAPVLMSASSQIVKFKNINQPLRPRVVPTGDYDIFNLLWSSANSEKPILKWGTTSGQYSNIVEAVTTSIPQSKMCGKPASTYGWRDVGLIHTAPLKGMSSLVPNSKIYYIFGDDATSDYSREYVFFVPPKAGEQPPTRPTTVILYDDMGRGSTDDTYTYNEYGRPSIDTAMSIGPQVARGEIDAIYHGGDISYATGYTAVWDFWLDMISNVASGTLYLTTVGNHESDYPNTASYYNVSDSGGECGVMTTTLMPMPAPATTDKPWWSYDVGLIHFVGMSTEHNYTAGSEQHQWIENDLASVDRTKTPWVIFGGHRAMYLNSDYGGTVTSDIVVMDNMIANLEPLLFKYRVNIGFYGHNHVVQRHAAVYNKTVIQKSTEMTVNGETVHVQNDPQATVHFVIGTAGAAFTKNAVDPRPDWNEDYFYEWGYTRVTAVNATYLEWEWLLSSTDEVRDHVIITQSDPTKPWVLPESMKKST